MGNPVNLGRLCMANASEDLGINWRRIVHTHSLPRHTERSHQSGRYGSEGGEDEAA